MFTKSKLLVNLSCSYISAPPGKVEDIRQRFTSFTTVRLSWFYREKNVKNYTVVLKSGSPKGDVVEKVVVNRRFHEINNLQNGTKYYGSIKIHTLLQTGPITPFEFTFPKLGK